jgi:ABC-2 type transport system ATP-binding protein
MPSNLTRYGHVLEMNEPKVKLRVERSGITEMLSAVLAEHVLEDVSVEDPPLEEVIAQVFAQTDGKSRSDAAAYDTENALPVNAPIS